MEEKIIKAFSSIGMSIFKWKAVELIFIINGLILILNFQYSWNTLQVLIFSDFFATDIQKKGLVLIQMLCEPSILFTFDLYSQLIKVITHTMRKYSSHVGLLKEVQLIFLNVFYLLLICAGCRYMYLQVDNIL